MNNEDFQKTILHELKNVIKQLDELKIGQKQFGVRQDEMYQVLRSIEHSNNVGKAELDSQNIRVSKIEGRLKKVSKAWQEDAEVSNL